MKKIKKFSEINENTHTNFNDAMNSFIIGQVAKRKYNYYDSVGTDYIGIEFENGYKYVSHGGGCSGEDCNSTLILDPNDKIISEYNW